MIHISKKTMDVDATNCRDVWLVKVPKYLAQSWKNAPSNSTLGKLQVPKNGVVPPKFVADPKLVAAAASSGPDSQIPSEHTMKLTPLTHQKMVILSQNKGTSSSANNGNNNGAISNNSNEKISVEGEVKFRGEMRPKGDMSYMNLKTTAIKQAAKPNRVTQILDKAVTSYKPRGASQLAHEADMRKRKEESKKMIREDKEVVQGRLFSAFEKQQYYNIKDLQRMTSQPIPYLKEVLKEYCTYCPSGTHKNMWELKPEYRHYKSASSSK